MVEKTVTLMKAFKLHRSNTQLVLFLLLIHSFMLHIDCHRSICRTNVYKSGYTLDKGLHQDNVRDIGKASSLDACNKLFCKFHNFHYALFDGTKCFGILCKGGRDRRCKLTKRKDVSQYVMLRRRSGRKQNEQRSHVVTTGSKTNTTALNRKQDVKDDNNNNNNNINNNNNASISNIKSNNSNLNNNNSSSSNSNIKHNIIDTGGDSRLKTKVQFHRKHRKRKDGHARASVSNISSSDVAHTRHSRDYPYDSYSYVLSPQHNQLYSSNFISSYTQPVASRIRQNIAFNPRVINNKLNRNRMNNRLVSRGKIPHGRASVPRRKAMISKKTMIPNTMLNAAHMTPYTVYNHTLIPPHQSAVLLGTGAATTQLHTPHAVTTNVAAMARDLPYINLQRPSRKPEVSLTTAATLRDVIANTGNNTSDDIEPLSEFPTDDYSNILETSDDGLDPHQDDLMKVNGAPSKDDIDVPFPTSNELENNNNADSSMMELNTSAMRAKITSAPPPLPPPPLPPPPAPAPLAPHHESSYRKMYLQRKNISLLDGGQGDQRDILIQDGSPSSGRSLLSPQHQQLQQQSHRDTIVHAYEDNTDISMRNRDQVPSPTNEEIRKSMFDIQHIQNEVVAHIGIPIVKHDQVAKIEQTVKEKPILGCVNAIGVSKRNIILDEQMSSSSQTDGYPASSARLQNRDDNTGYSGSWCASTQDVNSGKQPYLQIDGRGKGEVCRLATQGDEKLRRWVKRFKLRFSDDGKLWDSYKENGNTKMFFGNTDASDTTYKVLYHPISSRFIRFEPITWAGETPCMRVELFNTTTPNTDVISPASHRSTIPKEYAGVIMYLTFEKTDDGVVMDRSPYGNNGYMDGNVKIIDSHSSCRHAVRLEPGSDLHFDGRIMQLKPREAITIALWLKLNSKVSGVHSIFDTIGDHSKHLLGQFHFEVVGGDVRWFHRNETADVIFNVITNKKVITPSVWNHITVTYDSQIGTAVIYINGTQQVKGKGSGLISRDWNRRIGIGRHKGVRFLDGQIDEFKIYDVPLEKEQVEDLAKKCSFDKYYCGSTLTDTYGSLTSPGYPNSYPGPVECTWFIEGSVGEIISLDMKSFALGNQKSCGRGNLEVRDARNDTVIGNYCGSITPRKVRSHTHHMYIKYTTDGVFPGEKFKIDYTRERTFLAKKTLVGHCVPSKTLVNATLVGGAKAGNFTDLGIVGDMEECKERCCNTEKCEVAFMIEDNCYSVACTNRELCRVRKSKPTKLYPQLSFINRGLGDRPAFEPEIVGEPLEETSDKSVTMLESKDASSDNICPHNSVLSNVTLAGGIRAGVFTSHGVVDSFDDCLRYCCDVETCDAAFMVKRTCFSLHCASRDLCEPRVARPSSYHPMVSFLKRYSVVEDKGEKDTPKTHADDATVTNTKPTEDSCKNLRVSKIYKEVTLKGGINSGEFMDKGHISDMLECIAKCCAVDTCNVAFVIKETCFAVKCKSYEDCGLKTAVSAYYKPMIAYVNWSPPQQNLGDEVKYNYEGCWRDFDITSFALPLLEGTDTRLSEPYKTREDPVKECSSVAETKGYNVFAVQNGGACFSGPDAEKSYRRYGKSDACKAGKGGPFANSVYKSFEDGSVMSLGCWADLQDRAFKRMENKDPLIMDDYKNRAEPITQCAKVAQKMNIEYFAMQKGGQCFVAKEAVPNYKVFSLSRKCEYGLGGQMANDVYQLAKVDESERNKTRSDVIAPDEVVYKEEIVGDRRIQYVYSALSPIANVTLVSAINAGTFEDKGKVDSIMECVKECGEAKDCDVAFSLSSQCFNVHCYSEESCKTKPAFSNFYKPQLAYVKHRVINTSLSASSGSKRNCTGSSNLSNVTFVEGINAGNFSDMGSVESMADCKEKCCQDKTCNIAFKIQGDCYGVQCFSRTSCRTRIAKNAEVFNPSMVLIRPFQSPLDVELRKNEKHEDDSGSLTTTATTTSTTPSVTPSTVPSEATTTTPTPTIIAKCSADDWDEKVIVNKTLVGGINSGEFRDHGQAESMAECMGYCCSEPDCDLSFMIDKDCYSIRCYKASLCQTRDAKPTSFLPQIAIKKSSKLASDKPLTTTTTTTLTMTTTPTTPPPASHIKTPEAERMESAYASFKSILLGLPDIYNTSRKLQTTSNMLMDHLLDTSDSLFKGSQRKHSCRSEPIIYNATLHLGMHSGLFTKLGHVKTMDDCIERCCRSSNADVAYMLGTFCFAVKCKTRGMCKPSPVLYSDITSLNLNPAISFLTKEDQTALLSTSDDGLGGGNNVCGDSPITYNVTLRGGVHAGKFTELGEDISMRGCIERCCNTPLCDVSFMFSDKCYAVGCYDEALCQAVVAKPSNLNPKLAYVSKYRANAPLALYNMPSGVDFAYDDSTCSYGNVNHETIYSNKSLKGGMKSGNFTFLGIASDIKKCLSMCCGRNDCDMAYFVDKSQCFGVACYNPELCSLVDKSLKNRDVEISKLVRKKARKKMKKGTVLAYFLTGLVAIAIGLGGIIYAILIFIKRSQLKNSKEEKSKIEEARTPPKTPKKSPKSPKR